MTDDATTDIIDRITGFLESENLHTRLVEAEGATRIYITRPWSLATRSDERDDESGEKSDDEGYIDVAAAGTRSYAGMAWPQSPLRGRIEAELVAMAIEGAEHLAPAELVAAQADFGAWLEANGDELREEEEGNEYDCRDDADVIVAHCGEEVYIIDRWDAFAAWHAVVRGTTDTKAALARWWDLVPVKRETSIRRRRP